jgi:hypothetical protein
VTDPECDIVADDAFDGIPVVIDPCPALDGGRCECGRHDGRNVCGTEPAGTVGDALARLAASVIVPGPGGMRFDAGKLPVELLPVDALEEVARVLEFGAKKYARRNWEKGIKFSRVVGPLLRHVFKWLRGEDNDPETGLNHMAHAACNALFLVAYIKRGKAPELDDRCE